MSNKADSIVLVGSSEFYKELETAGNPAFPVSSQELGHFEGMTLRDYFAAKALQGLIASPNYGIVTTALVIVANDAYALADAMLEARKQPKGVTQSD